MPHQIESAIPDFPTLLGLNGPAGVGKTTLVRTLRELHPQLQIYSIATPLKRAAMELYDLTVDQVYLQKDVPIPDLGMTPRQILQKLGTEIAREIHPHTLLRQLARNVRTTQHHARQLTKTMTVVIDDVRFANESDYIGEQDGLVCRLDRDRFQPAPATHPTEQGIGANKPHEFSFTMRHAPGPRDQRRETRRFIEATQEFFRELQQSDARQK